MTKPPLRGDPPRSRPGVASPAPRFDSIDRALETLRGGGFVIVVDIGNPHGVGALTVAAESATPEAVNTMTAHARGLLGLCLDDARGAALGLHSTGHGDDARFGGAFTRSVDARHGVAGGGSVTARARTIAVAIDPDSGPDDLVSPGHLCVLRARPGGLLRRLGHTEAAVDLARLAGLRPAAVTCGILNDDGSTADLADLARYQHRHGFPAIRIEDVVQRRRRTEKLVERVVDARLPTVHGDFSAVGYRESLTGRTHVALVLGDVDGALDVAVRVHTACLTGDIFGSARCGCRRRLDCALRRIADEGRGVLLYLARDEQRGVLDELRAHQRQDRHPGDVLPPPTIEPLREYGIGAQILADLGLSTIRVISDDPRPIVGLDSFGITVTARFATDVAARGTRPEDPGR